MIKKMYNEPQVDVTVQIEPEQAVMLLSSGSAPEAGKAPTHGSDREV